MQSSRINQINKEIFEQIEIVRQKLQNSNSFCQNGEEDCCHNLSPYDLGKFRPKLNLELSQ